MTQQKRNTWFEETFLPSQEARMTNPKYYNQVILSERQEIVCLKYMKETYDNSWTYDIGTKHYWMHRAGKYTFLNLIDDSKAFWYIKSHDSEEYIQTFASEKEMENWIEEHTNDETGQIIGAEDISWYRGMGYRK